MTEHPLTSGATLTSGPAPDVAIIGAGPAGLAAATALKRARVARVVVLEREAQAGGIPRHCSHSPFGMREFARVLRGPAYAARLVERALRAGVEIHTATTVVEIGPGGALQLTLPEGPAELSPRRVILATGVRETPRSARLISGARVGGVINTGALQMMVHLGRRRPFRRPVILGSELVAFSAIMTCRGAGIRPVAMIEPATQVKARWPSAYFPRLAGVELLMRTDLVDIHGTGSVTGVAVRDGDGRLRHIDCDGVILSGQFTPEAALARCGHLRIDPATGGPLVDQWGRCSDPAYFATGNLLRPVETAGWSWREGDRAGQWLARDLAGGLPDPGAALHVGLADPRLKYAMPQRLVPEATGTGMSDLQLRVTRPVRGELVATRAGVPIWHRKIDIGPERRLLVPLAELALGSGAGGVELSIRPTGGDADR